MNKRHPEYIALYLFVFGAILLFGVLARKLVLVKGYDEFSAAVGFFATVVVLSALYISLQMTLNELLLPRMEKFLMRFTAFQKLEEVAVVAEVSAVVAEPIEEVAVIETTPQPTEYEVLRANAIAEQERASHKTGRDIILIDVAKLHSSFTGDTEKNYRELFRAYRYLVHLSSNAPIMLFNEADGILSKRGDVLRQAVDKICNRIQSLLLQELEDFEGIMIATTNLAENMDEAFDRRFLFKIKFNEPDVKTRTLIGKSMIPDLSDEVVNMLATRYKFTGAQIDNIAKKRDIDEMLDGSTPSFAKMLEYCEDEVLISAKGDEVEKTLPISFSQEKTYRMKS